MSLMDLIKKISSSKSEKKEKFKQMQEDFMMQKTLEERQKSSNRRELERFMKEDEEKQIKKQLDIIRKQKQKEAWNGNIILKNNGMNILRDNKKLLRNDKPILHQKNIFLDNKTNMPLTNQEMFFKW